MEEKAEEKEYPDFAERFPSDFFDLTMSNKTFEWVFNNKLEFVDFTLTEMIKPTGFFKQWKDYCVKLNKVRNGNCSTNIKSKQP